VAGETKVGDAVEQIAEKAGLTPTRRHSSCRPATLLDAVQTPDERAQLLPSGKQTMFADRVHWAKTYI
jgi:restriction endonuclease Mrr